MFDEIVEIVTFRFFFKIRQNFCKAEKYFKPYQTSIMELFWQIVSSEEPLPIFTKSY